jgi:hypothetical protein
MMTNPLMDQIRLTATPRNPAEDDSPDRRILLRLLSLVMAGYETARSPRMPSRAQPAEWLERWDDEEYTYLETRIPGEASDLDLDLNVQGGVIFARVRRRCADPVAEAGTPHPEPLGRAREVRA